jgi:hypothetical protein
MRRYHWDRISRAPNPASVVYRSGISTSAGKLTNPGSLHARSVALVTTSLLSLLASLVFFATPVFAVGDASTLPGEKCPNENLSGFSSHLPDCRAYEQVTPPFISGTETFGDAISESGSQVLGNSLGGFAGTQNDHTAEGAFYVFSRLGSGWEPAAISPPDGLFPAVEFRAASPGLERSLWLARSPSQSIFDEDLYVREADGEMVEVGPVLDPELTKGPPAGEESHFFYIEDVDFQAASDDLSHVVFSLRSAAPLWPRDTTSVIENGDNVSLYEYTGVGEGQPELVGVSDGKTERGGKPLAAGTLISNCETNLGSENRQDTYNALSGDGGVVFFTAVGQNVRGCPLGTAAPEVSEVYARVDGFRTIPISEPRRAACSACDTSVPSPGFFAGASEDGTQAFFLSEQELFAGVKSMNLYEYDFDAPEGEKVALVSSGAGEAQVQGVARVSEDGSHVYFVARGVLTGANGEGGAPVGGGDNLYVYERDEANPAGRLAFVATLSPEDERDWSLTDERPVQASADGRFLVFSSVADLTVGDESVLPQIFEYDAQNEQLARVSVGQAGYAPGGENANNNPSFTDSQEFGPVGESPAAAASDLVVSGDGGTVVFASPGALAAAAQTAAGVGALSVYEYRSSVASVGGSIQGGNVYLVSDGEEPSEAQPQGIDASGDDIFLETVFENANVLAAGNSQRNVYDARVGGGFPLPVGTGECAGEACQGGVPLIQPILPPPSSASVTGNSNLTTSAPSSLEPPAEPSTPKTTTPKSVTCKKGFVKKGKKCVKAKKRTKGKKSAKGRK